MAKAKATEGGHTFKRKGREVSGKTGTYALFVCSQRRCPARKVLRLSAKGN